MNSSVWIEGEYADERNRCNHDEKAEKGVRHVFGPGMGGIASPGRYFGLEGF